MALSLHAEYLLGYLAGARSMPIAEAQFLGRAGAPDAAQSRALLKALALGVADARRGRPPREASEVRMHVLTLVTRENPGSGLARVKSGAESVRPPVPSAAPLTHDSTTASLSDLIRQASTVA